MTFDERLALNFRALSHPRRARIFRMLADDPNIGASYGALQMATGLCDSSLIHHLRDMEKCGVITRKRKGSEVQYALRTETFVRAIGQAQAMVNELRLKPFGA